jgi:gamma-tubulin complex component 3
MRRWLEAAVGEVQMAVSSHLLDIVMQHHSLPRHLAAIKRFLLLGQGDFVRVLLDVAQHELDKGAKDVSQYSLQVGGMQAFMCFLCTGSFWQCILLILLVAYFAGPS